MNRAHGAAHCSKTAGLLERLSPLHPGRYLATLMPLAMAVHLASGLRWAGQLPCQSLHRLPSTIRDNLGQARSAVASMPAAEQVIAASSITSTLSDCMARVVPRMAPGGTPSVDKPRPARGIAKQRVHRLPTHFRPALCNLPCNFAATDRMRLTRPTFC